MDVEQQIENLERVMGVEQRFEKLERAIRGYRRWRLLGMKTAENLSATQDTSRNDHVETLGACILIQLRQNSLALIGAIRGQANGENEARRRWKPNSSIVRGRGRPTYPRAQPSDSGDHSASE